MVDSIQTVVDRLSTLNLPLAYSHFEEAQEPPFLCYLVNGSDSWGADDKSFVKKSDISVEFYTACRDFDTEKLIENLFNDVELHVDNNFLADEQMSMTTFDFEIIEKI